jgi:RNA polymerase sigma-B factor
MGTTIVAAPPRARAPRRRSRAAQPRRSRIRGSDDRLFRRAREGDAAAREELVCHFLPMARSLARRYQRGNEPLDDLVQVASIGLVKALSRFEPERGVAFPGYAVPTIVGELEVDRAAESLRRALGRSPTAEELARELRIDVADVTDALSAATAYDAVSLDSPAHGSGDDQGPAFVDSLGAEERRYEVVEHVVTIEPALRALPTRQRAVLRLRFSEDMTQAEIAARLGMSQMHVSRLLRQALARLREVARVRHGQ